MRGAFPEQAIRSDGSAFPEQAIRFYREAGYDFLGISDHNVYADSHRVRKVGGKGKRIVKQEILDAYKREFPGCVETETAADGSLNVVIQPYAKMRKLFEKPGEFLLLDAVEGTTHVYDENGVEHAVHMNYLNVPGVAQRIGDSLKAVEALAKEKGRESMFILNHPIWRWYDVKPEDLVANPEVRFFEVCNGGSPYAPGKGLPSDGFATDRFWDAVNAFRARRGQPLLYGVGNDDTHGYFGTVSHSPPGIHCIPYNAWSLVRAEALTAEALIRAMNAGDFAVCEGVQPEDFSFDAASGTLARLLREARRNRLDRAARRAGGQAEGLRPHDQHLRQEEDRLHREGRLGRHRRGREGLLHDEARRPLRACAHPLARTSAGDRLPAPEGARGVDAALHDPLGIDGPHRFVTGEH